MRSAAPSRNLFAGGDGMDEHREPAGNDDYPHGRGYCLDYMLGGEVFGGYGYSEREEYDRTRGELRDPNADGSTHRHDERS